MKHLFRSALAVLFVSVLATAQSIFVPGNGAPVAVSLSNTNPSGSCVASAQVYNYSTGHTWGCVGTPGAMTWVDLLTKTSAYSVSVTDYGADPTGVTVATTAIQTAMSNNLTATVIVPPGTYLLNNASGANGLQIPLTFTGTLWLQPGAMLQCNTATTSAGVCVSIGSSNNTTAAAATNNGLVVRGLHIGYLGVSAGTIPLARANATNFALLVNVTKNITFYDTRIDSSTGSCAWFSNNQNLASYNTQVTGCTADGWHRENSNGHDHGVIAINTGDDGYAITQTSPLTYFDTTLCGTTAEGVSTSNSQARGIAVVGGCQVAISDWNVSNTSASGALIGNQAGYTTPTDVKLSHGFSTNAGTYATPGGSYAGLEINGTRNSFNDVKVDSPNKDGVYMSSCTNCALTNVYVRNSGSVTNGAAFDLEQSTGLELTGNVAESTQGSGFFLYQSGPVVATGNMTINVGIADSNHRSFWSNNATGPISVYGLQVIDTQATATGYVVGEYSSGNYPVQFINVLPSITNGTFTWIPQSTYSYLMQFQALKATTGTRALCISTLGVVTSSASACSGT